MSEIFSFRGKIKSLDELNKIEKPVRNEIYYCEENDLHFFWNGCKWICINDEMIKELAKEHEVRGIMSDDIPSSFTASRELLHASCETPTASREELLHMKDPEVGSIWFCEDDGRSYWYSPHSEWLDYETHELLALTKEHVIEQINKLQAELLEWKIKLADMIVNGEGYVVSERHK